MEPVDPFPRPFRMLLRPGKGSRGKNERGSEPNEKEQYSISLASDSVAPNVSNMRDEQGDNPITNQHSTRSQHANERTEHQFDSGLASFLETHEDSTQNSAGALPHDNLPSMPTTFTVPENSRHESTDRQRENDQATYIYPLINLHYSYNPEDPAMTRNESSHKQPFRPARSQRIEKQSREKARIFPCTFCYDKFKRKHDWVRHERSLHLDLETWTCAPDHDPTPEHLEEHNHNVCAGTDRTFSRKDHLMQHLRLVHHVSQVPVIENWKKNAPPFGDHGFPPSIAVQVRNAIPPYLIAQGIRTSPYLPRRNDASSEQMDLDQIGLAGPSRTSNLESTDNPQDSSQQDNLPEDIQVFSDVIALHISRFARENIQKGIFPTEEMFQKETQRLTENWKQIIADNLESVTRFQQQQAEDVQGDDVASTDPDLDTLLNFLS
ncbi:hypothetical protein P170DRAFT_464371 [Aspergillus steynii IBT 23096]|uniref:C2H2-type domain-containing protein n=1 Tax=Aspergillus steynii IBT 23096 TaxID=1392250 RepID=A0A2I2G759_9EURO|nr:uncharacterized protein P170DRAFT_464371 [Aspergillus steynii IBT 23096]PLB48713.1 hypothetical protein P170DRAFT_464371 [Aspergillus steynii IBT 23096]